MAEIIIYYWTNIDLQAVIQLILRELCALTYAELYMWHVLVFFPKH